MLVEPPPPRVDSWTEVIFLNLKNSSVSFSKVSIDLSLDILSFSKLLATFISEICLDTLSIILSSYSFTFLGSKYSKRLEAAWTSCVLIAMASSFLGSFLILTLGSTFFSSTGVFFSFFKVVKNSSKASIFISSFLTFSSSCSFSTWTVDKKLSNLCPKTSTSFGSTFLIPCWNFCSCNCLICFSISSSISLTSLTFSTTLWIVGWAPKSGHLLLR